MFRDKFLCIGINFVKIQIDTSYYIGNIRQQNGFVFHIEYSTCMPNTWPSSYRTAIAN